MKLSIDYDHFKLVLEVAKRVTSGQAVSAQPPAVLLAASDGTVRGTISGAGGRAAVVVPAEVAEDGRVVLGLNLVAGWLAGHTASSVEIDSVGDMAELRVPSAKLRAPHVQLVGDPMPPARVESGTPLPLGKDGWSEVRRLSWACNDQAGAAFGLPLLEDGLLLATDRQARIAVRPLGEASKGVTAAISPQVADLVALADPDLLEVETDGDHVWLSDGTIEALVPTVAFNGGVGPTLAKLGARDYPDSLVADADSLKDALERVAKVATRDAKSDIRRATLAIEKGVARVTGSDGDRTEAEELVAVDATAEQVFNLNPVYLADAVSACGSSTVRLSYAGPLDPIKITPEPAEEGSFYAFIIGIRV